MQSNVLLSLLLIGLLLSSCDSAPADDPAGPGFPDKISGTVFGLTTGEPLSDIRIQAIRFDSRFGGLSTDTDSNGAFELTLSEYDDIRYVVVNYQGLPPTVGVWTSRDSGAVALGLGMRIGLEDYGGLDISLETDVPLGPDDSLIVETPCGRRNMLGLGPDQPAYCYRAPPNAVSEVTLIVRRDGVRTARTEQVYIPVNETVGLNWTY